LKGSCLKGWSKRNPVFSLSPFFIPALLTLFLYPALLSFPGRAASPTLPLTNLIPHRKITRISEMQFIACIFASLAFISLAASGVFAQNPHTPLRSRHLNRLPSVGARGPENDLAVRGPGTLQRRFDQARFSFYAVGLGACGKTNVASDYIVALNSAQYGSGGYCFQMITITYGGKSCQAQITDECPGCPYGGLDLSPGLFDYFASESAGIIYGSWEFGSGAATTTKTQAPKTTQTPTSTWSAPTSSTQTSSSTTSSSASSSTSALSSAHSADAYRSASSSSVAPTSTAVSLPTDVIGQLDFAFVQIGSIFIAGAQGL